MNKKTQILIFWALISGCASYGTYEERMVVNKESPDYILCEKLFFKTNAPEKIRSEWAIELQNRGNDCSSYSTEFSARIIKRNADILNYNAHMLNYRQQQMNMQQQNPVQTNCRQIGANFSCTSW